MGGGASYLALAIEKQPEQFDAYRQEIASLFAKEFAALREEGDVIIQTLTALICHSPQDSLKTRPKKDF
jgi:hypothetical protein